MERYKVLEELGDGTCGSVYKAINMETSEIVAVKKMKRKFYSWDECMNLREVKSLRKLNHPNIIKLKEIVRENNELFFILDYMEYNLYQIMRGRQKPFFEEEIRAFISQVLRGLAHMHRNGYFHRDLKPGTEHQKSCCDTQHTLLPSTCAVGAILAELFTLCPIFPGESEIDQLYKIRCVLGTPDWITFPEAQNISLLINISYSEIMPANLSDIIPNASLEAIDLIKQLCSWDPLKRPTADQSLLHPFFHGGTRIPRSIWDPLQLKLNSMGHAPNLELKLWDFSTQPDLGLTLAVNPSVSNLDISHKVPKGAREDLLFFSGFQDHPQQSVFWSLLSPDHNRITRPVESSLSLSFSPIPNSSIGVPQSTKFTFTSLQPNMLDRSFLARSFPFQQSRCL